MPYVNMAFWISSLCPPPTKTLTHIKTKPSSNIADLKGKSKGVIVRQDTSRPTQLKLNQG